MAGWMTHNSSESGSHLSELQIDNFTDRLWEYEMEGHEPGEKAATEEQFKARTRALAEELDPKVKSPRLFSFVAVFLME